MGDFLYWLNLIDKGLVSLADAYMNLVWELWLFQVGLVENSVGFIEFAIEG